ncbi:MAG: M48 family metallopeptidase [Aliivibrio sp.]|uniref:M48 metallopeptidase family protein n=1 Tax=Aliivibrio sp. TaxID=1872443 RepID=UPI001A571091|nr:M48 family metallopeptidase [Aliivibrio sp.]
MTSLVYLQGYSDKVQQQAKSLIDEDRLGAWLLNKYPSPHTVTTEKSLYSYVMTLKKQFLKKSSPLSKIAYDGKIGKVHQALGLHTYVSRVQGGKLKSKNELRVGTIFKAAPEPMLKMIVVHELAHLKEKEHNKAFYNLCCHMEPNYHQLELDTRLFLTYLDTNENPY